FIVQDRVTGTLAVGDLTGRTFSEDEIELTEAFANQAAVALEHARLLGEAERRTAELDATNQELEAFSYSVSHDLRAPLRGIDGFSQALMNEYSDVLDEQAQHYLERVRTGSERMGQLIDDLLALSQVTRGEMRRENVDLSDLARTIVTGLQERDPQRQVEFVIQDGVVLNGDTRLLRVALENLLGNAWKYTGKHDQARIEFGLTEDDGKRTCFIRDDGSGFDMAYADRLFGAFQRLHDASEFEGSGIGLATVQRIINRHGGRIWAESAVDEGATFFFTLH
ncbi:MAG: histidine kinase, partial [Chloroflexi bacterium]|nr:histidine kinase [Chloroflexota bacterium]